jgi:hypothetical protein
VFLNEEWESECIQLIECHGESPDPLCLVRLHAMGSIRCGKICVSECGWESEYLELRVFLHSTLGRPKL